MASRSFMPRHSPPSVAARPSELSAAPRGLVVLSSALFGLITVKNLWLSDDAYITFRTIDNALHGYGLTWNTDERVQSFTHPLWMLLLTAVSAVIPHIALVALVLGIGCSVGAATLFAFGIAGSRVYAVLGLLALTASKSFVDFSTSGLENPLTHCLIALFVLLYLRHHQDRATFATYTTSHIEARARAVMDRLGQRMDEMGLLSDRRERYLFFLGIIAGLVTLNRQDAVLFLLPALAADLWRAPRLRSLFVVALGFLPLAAWEVFSVWYYGFPFPNTAYAKLHTGIPTRDYLVYGVHYLWDSSVRFDPVLLLIPVGLILPLFFKERRSIALALGGLLYLVYVVQIGGDFMAGRFLTTELLLAVLLLSRLPVPRPISVGGVTLGLAALACLVAGFFVTNATIFAVRQRKYEIRYYRVIGDERSVWGRATDLAAMVKHPIPFAYQADQGRKARAQGQTYLLGDAVGFLGYEAGPHVHVEDIYALNDMLLARLPSSDWVIGHFPRRLPPGYVATLQSGTNQIADRGLAAYYDNLRVITSGGLLDPLRLVIIFKMNTGQYDYLLRTYVRQLSPPKPYLGPLG